MDKETQRIAWSCLPKEFKEEVKAHYAGLNAAYKAYLSKDSLSNEECDRCNVLREKMALYQMYFGYRNLTSDAEGEEMLMVPRSKVQGLYDLACEIHADGTKDWYQGYMKAMQDLFGSKCLPDEEPKQAEPKFKFKEGDKVSRSFDGKVYTVDDYWKKIISIIIYL